MDVAGGEAIALTVRPLRPESESTPLLGVGTPLYLSQARTARVWILEGQGEAVAVATATGGEVFPAWAQQVDEVVQSLEWGSTR